MSVRSPAGIDRLESRRHLTAITVTGSSGADDIRVWVEVSTLFADVNGITQSYPDFIYDGVSVTASGGADRIYIDSNGDNPVTINPGSGLDEIHFGESTGDMDNLTSAVSFAGASGDQLFLHDDAVGWADTYTVNNATVARAGLINISYTGFSAVRLYAGDGADVFNIVNTNGVPLTIDGQGGADKLNLNVAGNGLADVYFDTHQDFAEIQSSPGGNLTLTGAAGLLLTGNLSNVEGNITLDRGFVVERNNVAVSGGLGYWRDRIGRGASSTTPYLRSAFAAGSTVEDAIGYAYASDLSYSELGGFDLLPGDLVMRYTLKGDANLDLSVGFTDLLSLAQNYNGTTRDWIHGDFDGNRAVNFNDLLALAQNYNASAMPTLKADKSKLKPASRVGPLVL